MMKRATLAIADIYVPVKRRATLDQKRVDEIAASILDKGLQTPMGGLWELRNLKSRVESLRNVIARATCARLHRRVRLLAKRG
jgi:hypothetical protein